ncbi:MAG: hypothetical protein ABR567_06835 [Myxococcales bacterium]|nr:nucleotidyltransferase [Myxococcales bacterium]
MDFAKVLGAIATFLERRRFALAGAFAMQAHGLQRATADLDFVVEDAARVDLLRFMKSLGYEELHASEGYSNHLHADPALGRVDFIYLDAHTADVLFADAQRKRVGSLDLLVPSPEHLAAMKVHAIKNSPVRLYKELADIQFLLELPGVDEEKIRGYFEKHGLRGRFDELKRIIIGRDHDPDDPG